MNARTSWLVGLLLLTLVGCGDHPTPPAEPASPSSTSTPTADPAGCSDGSCELTVTGPVTIVLDPRFGISHLKVKPASSDSLSLTATFAPGTGAQAISTGGSCSTEMESGSDDEPAHLKATCDTGTRLRLPTVTIDIDSAPAGAVLLRISPR